MKFSVKASALNAALDVVSIVTPRPLDKQGASGYLLVIRGEKGYVYSRGDQHVARADFPLESVEGEGPFIYPQAGIGSLKSFSDDILAFEVSDDDDKNVVKYSTMNGKAWEERPTFDHRLCQTCDKDLDKATNERAFTVPVLREALALSKSFTDAKEGRPGADEKHRTIVMFDKNFETDDPKNPGQKIKPCEKGDGVLFAMNGIQAFYFYSDAFLDRHFSVHSAHLNLFQNFLGKAVGQITLKTGGNMTFAEDSQGHVVGWTHSNAASSPKYSYYSLGDDTHVMTVDRSVVLRALKHVQQMLDAKTTAIKLSFDASEKTIQFQVIEGSTKGQSWPIPVIVNGNDPHGAKSNEAFSFGLNMNVKHFIDLFEGCKGHHVELRVAYRKANEKRPKDHGMFRTVDSFFLDANGKVVGDPDTAEKVPEGAATCRVTRFTPSLM